VLLPCGYRFAEAGGISQEKGDILSSGVPLMGASKKAEGLRKEAIEAIEKFYLKNMYIF